MSMNARNVAVAGILVAVSFLTGCGLGGNTTTLTLQTQVASIPAGEKQKFSAVFFHKKHQIPGGAGAFSNGGKGLIAGSGKVGKCTKTRPPGKGGQPDN